MGETIAEYDAALRKLAATCEFGDALQDTLRDRLVCGLTHESVQRRLLSEKELTYAKAIEIARGMEAADKVVRSFKAIETPINKLQRVQKSKKKEPTSCYRCGRSNHLAADCKFKDARCHLCRKTGHIAPACRSKPKSKPHRHTGKHQTHVIKEKQTSSDEADSSDGEFKINQLGKPTPYS